MLRWLFGPLAPLSPPQDGAQPVEIPSRGPIRLGDKVKDRVTAFEGIADCRMEFLNGCVRWNVQPQSLHEGEPIKAHVFDEQQLEVIAAKAIAVPVVINLPPTLAPNVARALVAARTGGDRPTPQRRTPDGR